MYLLTIVLCLFLSNAGLYYAKDFSWEFLVFLQNLYRANFDFLPHTYSLTIEEWFYLFFPVAVLFLLKLFPKMKTNPILVNAIGWIFIAFLVRLLIHFNGVTNWDTQIRKTIIGRLDATIYGVLFYFIQLHFPKFIKDNKIKLVVIGYSLYLIGTFILAKGYSPFFNNVVYYTFVPFVSCFVLAFFMHLRLSERIEKAFTFISLASYSIYIIHLPLLYVIFGLYKPISKSESLLILAGVMLLVNVIGILFYKLVEKPIMNLRDK